MSCVCARLWVLVAVAVVIQAHIYSAPSKITYNYDGHPQYYSLFVSLESGIGASDYLKVIWPESIHNTRKDELTVNLISFSNNLQVASTTCVHEAVSNSQTYHVSLGYAMQPNTWY